MTCTNHGICLEDICKRLLFMFMCKSGGGFLKEDKVRGWRETWLGQQRWRPPGAAGSTNILSYKNQFILSQILPPEIIGSTGPT